MIYIYNISKFLMGWGEAGEGKTKTAPPATPNKKSLPRPEPFSPIKIKKKPSHSEQIRSETTD